VLKLFPRPRANATAFVGLASPQAALSLLTLAQERAGHSVVTFELLPRIGLDFVLRHSPGSRDPLSGAHAWYVLIELASQAAQGLQETAETLLAEALEKGIAEDAALANSLVQRNAFWGLREHLSEVQKHEGGSIKHDVSVPVAAVPSFIEAATVAVEAALPGARVVAFGHLGDGNIHFNVSQPIGVDKEAFLSRWHEINDIVHAIVASYGGSISAEHGIGRLKRDLLPKVKDPVALDVMRALKRTLDPKGLLNPGKVL
jgi:FAD/FMN-containing dehydrogenase